MIDIYNVNVAMMPGIFILNKKNYISGPKFSEHIQFIIIKIFFEYLIRKLLFFVCIVKIGIGKLVEKNEVSWESG